MNRTKLLLASLALFLLPVALAQPGKGGTIAVSASGTAYGEPDEASFDAGVSALNEDVQVASSAVTEGVSSLLTALRQAGIEERDIRTTNFSIYPEQSYDNSGQPGQLRYRVVNTVHVTVRDTDKLGRLLGLSVEAGANEVSNVVFSVADPEALERQAREEAMKAAYAKAVQLAALAPVELGGVRQISEATQGGSAQPLPQFRMEAMSADTAGANVPVSSGQLAVTVTVQVVYSIR